MYSPDAPNTRGGAAQMSEHTEVNDVDRFTIRRGPPNSVRLAPL
jgi:hypothetical protein